MATSIQIMGDKAEMFNDLDLLALLCLLELEFEDRDGAIASLISEWRAGLKLYGPGTIDLKLDYLATSVELRRQLISLLAIVQQNVEKYGEVVPGSLLNERCGVPGVNFSDYPISSLIAAIVKLQKLLAVTS